MKYSIKTLIIILILQLVLPISIAGANNNSKIKVNVDVLNVRSGPGLEHKVIDQIRKNEQYPALENSNQWVRIQLKGGQKGWVADWLVTNIQSASSASYTTYISSKVNGLNVRTGPGLTFPVLAQIYPSEKFVLKRQEGQWSNIDYKGKSSWVASWLIDKDQESKKTDKKESNPLDDLATITADLLNVRSGPSTSHQIVGGLYQGEQVEIINVKNGWYEIKFKSGTAWIAGDYVKKKAATQPQNKNEDAKPTNIKAKVTASVLNVRDEGSLKGNVIDQIARNTEVEIVKENNDWANISYGNKSGWVAGWFLERNKDLSSETPVEQSDSPKVTLLYNGTNLRSGPSTNNSIVERGNKGDQFPIISKEEDWYKILLPDQTEAFVAGWIVTASNSIAPVQQENIADFIEGKTIVLDPGHGGRDSGAIGCCNKTFEKKLTLKTANLVAAKLKSAGAKVILTRSNDSYSSLMFRVSVANYYNADAFISLHYNSSIYPSARGIMSFYYDSGQEKELAEVIQNEMLKKVDLKDRGTRFGNYHVLRTNKQPSVLLELGFLSNPEEEYLVTTESYQENISNAIYLGLGRYFQNK